MIRRGSAKIMDIFSLWKLMHTASLLTHLFRWFWKDELHSTQALLLNTLPRVCQEPGMKCYGNLHFCLNSITFVIKFIVCLIWCVVSTCKCRWWPRCFMKSSAPFIGLQKCVCELCNWMMWLKFLSTGLLKYVLKPCLLQLEWLHFEQSHLMGLIEFFLSAWNCHCLLIRWSPLPTL